MKRQLAFVWLASGLALMLIPFAFVQKSRVSAGNLKTNPPARELARLGAAATVHAAGRGAPRINLADGRDVLTAYAGDPEAQRLLQQNMVQPIAMASADFDEDGMQDLISAYAGPAEGIITLHRGNVDAMFPESPEANQRKARGEFTDAPFRSPAHVFKLPDRPDFIGAGDFNSDGHCDVIFASRGASLLHLLPGDGSGGFGPAVTVPLPGRVTSMITGEISRRDGPSAVVVGVTSADGPKMLVFQGSRGVASPETIDLPAEANALALGHFDNASEAEVAVAAGSSLMIVHVGTAASAAGSRKISVRSFPFAIESLAVGDFTGNHSADLALLSGDGEVVVLSRPIKLSPAPIKDWSSQPLSGVRLPRVSQLSAARISSLPLDTIVVASPTEHQLRLLTGNAAASTDVRAASTDAALDAEGQPVAVLPMRLNGDALSDLVVLTKGRGAPTVIITGPPVTFTVNSTGDGPDSNLADNVCNDGTGNCTLRAAIQQANATAGTYVINFALGAGTPTIKVGSTTGMPLPPLFQPVFINGNTGGSTHIELDGSLAGTAGADGLGFFAGNSTVQGMVINRFFGAGIAVRQNNNSFVQGNFIGTNTAGTASGPGNMGGGIVISQSSGNTIGGTTAASRNVISGNGNTFTSGIALSGGLATNNLVQGNFIGTDASGAAPVPNAGNGVGIDASNNTVGGTLAGASNVIAFNTGVGADVLGGTGNAILSNSIFSNGSLGINLADDGGAVTLNDVCDGDIGANNLQNFPVLTSASSGGGNTTIIGTLNSTPGTTFRIEFFSSATCDPSGNGEGQTFIGFTTVATPPAVCDAPINVTLPVAVTVGNVITATATDPSNNTSEFSACVTVMVGCSITCPPNQTQANNPNQCGAKVTYPAPTTTGPCGTVTCTPASGSFFPKGTTTVNCTTTALQSCLFTVTVNDTQAPTITCPPNVTQSTAPNLCSAVVGYAAPIVSDNCPGVGAATCNPPSGSTFPKGTTNVNCSATDSSANTSSCSFTVTVNDTQPPMITCPPNQTVVATIPTVVNYPPPTAADNCPGVSTACNPPSGATFPVGTTTVTCTATDTSGNTASCNFTVTVAGCTITCPPDLSTVTSPNATACGAAVNFSPTATGSCGTLNCAPPSGSLFAVGTTKVTCTTTAGPSCSFTVTVVDNTPPRVSCPPSLSTTAQPGQSSALVNYPAATVTDNCPGASVECTPPSGTRFPVGGTVVICTGTDASSNSATCAFAVFVIDAEAPVIRCPANVNAAPPPGQTSAVVNYPPPTVTDNVPGVKVVCSPASGSSFPAGTTTVTCTATDTSGNKASCSFIVGVGGPLLKVTIPGNKAAVEFATVPPARKPPKPKNNPCSFFTVENIGFAPLVLTLDSISRTGSDVDNKRIADPNDTRFFSVSLVNSDQSLTLLDIGAVLTLQPGQPQILCARFAALIPAAAGKTNGLAASDVLPDTVTSRISFRQNAGANAAVPVLARVATGVVLIDPANPRRLPVVGFTRSGNDITVSYAVFDSNLDVSRAKYEFLDANGQVVAGPFEIDLTEPVRSLNLVKGQSFSVEQRFTGAASHTEIVGVRLTVFDGEISVVGSSSASATATPISASSIQLIKQARGVTLYLPDVKLGPQLP